MHTGPVLNPELDLDRAASAFAQSGRVHIRDILTYDSAARLHQCLSRESDFSLLCDDVHYRHDSHVLSRDGEGYPDPAHALAAITDFLGSAPLLDFARRVTGNGDIAFADAQAVRYRQGQFRNGYDEGLGRVAAYMLDLTPRWRPDWGGALLFSDRPGHISGGYLPAFNTLALVAPQEHLVGLVSPFAGAAHYSITGWFRTR